MVPEMLGASPEHVLLVGVVGQSYEPGQPLSKAVHESFGDVIGAILQELKRLGLEVGKRTSAAEPAIWWSDIRPRDSHPITHLDAPTDSTNRRESRQLTA